MTLALKNPVYKIESPHSLRKLAEWDHGKMELESIVCPINEGHQRSGRRLTNLHIVLPDGEVEDFVWTWYSECLILESTLELLRSSSLTGFYVKPVQARFEKSTATPPKLWELVVTGWAGMAKPKSGIRFDESKSCPVCGHLKYTGLTNANELIDESKWDGSDFFMVWPLPRFVLVTERVVRLVREAELSGVSILPVSKLKPTDSFGPGRLSYWMPDARARELGEPLGIY